MYSDAGKSRDASAWEESEQCKPLSCERLQDDVFSVTVTMTGRPESYAQIMADAIECSP